jgi:hypothetical protein
MRLLSALLLLALITFTTPSSAQTPIHRCTGPNGNPLFTDQPCAALQATPLSTPVKAGDDNHSNEPPPVMCAANVAALRKSVIDAFANHDANRMAGLILWSGYGHAAAVADIRSLSMQMRQPLLDLGPSGDPPADADPSTPSSAGSSADPFAPTTPVAAAHASDQLVLHTAGNDGSGSPHELRFSIVRRSGCLWLRNAD